MGLNAFEWLAKYYLFGLGCRIGIGHTFDFVPGWMVGLQRIGGGLVAGLGSPAGSGQVIVQIVGLAEIAGLAVQLIVHWAIASTIAAASNFTYKQAAVAISS